MTKKYNRVIGVLLSFTVLLGAGFILWHHFSPRPSNETGLPPNTTPEPSAASAQLTQTEESSSYLLFGSGKEIKGEMTIGFLGSGEYTGLQEIVQACQNETKLHLQIKPYLAPPEIHKYPIIFLLAQTLIEVKSDLKIHLKTYVLEDKGILFIDGAEEALDKVIQNLSEIFTGDSPGASC